MIHELEIKELILSKKTQKEGDGDYLVNTDTHTDISETNKRDQRKHHDLHRTLHIPRIGHDDYSVDTAIDLESNVTRNIDLSASTSVATQLTENADDMVEEGKEMSSDDLISIGDYSDYDILDEEKDYISKNDLVWVKTKKEIWRGRVLLVPYSKNNEDREHLKIKWTDKRKEERILIKNVSLNYPPKAS